MATVQRALGMVALCGISTSGLWDGSVTCNGGSYKSLTLLKLENELKPALKFINNLPEYASISEFVKKTYNDNENTSVKIISRIFHVI